ncbi:hypothetical protein [Dialister invisus]|uniref:hypothetical protein n=1 Tax=Dialister invisus TaxID=218538 RepID=UPI0023F772F4|nr:hypothetical protein [Dialister invisus]
MKTSHMIRDSIKYDFEKIATLENPTELGQMIESLRPKFRRLEKAYEDEASGEVFIHSFLDDVKEDGKSE